ncbi:DUF7483 domain-containing protein [Varunaivibrio sulfuroxidans]|uniref:DUF7483 domain-containing protein n=1 Tax=Varunaivibrio sulfuroxidans TaxID=1773489 RepID=A0A4R3J8J4_9PROT|nr:LamG-like jellyroll fold domain-containing protein [Varunaivibrio sulfuroxidans]TCS61685.1 hypothetical protein EDD55_10794 [Varunaivibrio sulfuroxidans]
MGMILSPFSSSTGANDAVKDAALLDGVSGYLSRTPVVAGNGGVWSFSCWVKPTATGTVRSLFSDAAPTFSTIVRIMDTDQIAVDIANQVDTSFRLTTTAVFRDVSAWMHVLVAVNTSAATAADRVKIYVNGDLQSVTGTYPTTAFGGGLSASYPWTIGYNHSAAPYDYTGYIAAAVFTDGHTLTPTIFGKTDPVSGNWTPKKPNVAAYGANGFYLNFKNGGALGADVSGNGNNFIATGIVTQSTDTPTNNHAVLNPATNLSKAGGFFYRNGNRTVVTAPANTNYCRTESTFYFSGLTGCRATITHIGQATSTFVGVRNVDTGTLYAFRADGQWFDGAAWSVWAGGWIDGDVIVPLCDPVSGELTFIRSGVGVGAKTIPPGNYIFVFNAVGGVSTGGQWDVDFNDAYVGTTYLSKTYGVLTTNGLTPVTGKNVHDHFNTVAYTGGVPTITGVGFRPDFMWVKSRSLISNHVLFDSVRGLIAPASGEIYPNLTNVEAATGAISSMSGDGWAYNLTDANYNGIGDTYVAWCAKLPNIVTSGWAGSPTITPTEERCNPTLGMSIVSYTGNATLGATIPHSLGKKPAVVIVKNRVLGIGQWMVYHRSLGATNYLLLQDTYATLSSVSAWNNTAPTAQLITLGNFDHVNAAGSPMIAYIFAESDFIKVGGYTGNGLADGPFVNANISPVWTMTKRTDVADGWYIQDDVRAPANPRSAYLRADATAVEDTSAVLTDFTATGVKTRTTLAATNALGGTYVYLMIGQPLGGRNTTEAVGR